MFRLVFSFFGWFRAFHRSRSALGREMVALRHHIGVLTRKNFRSTLSPWDQVWWIFLRPGLVPVAGLGGPSAPWAVPSPDGRHLAVYSWSLSANIWMMENF